MRRTLAGSGALLVLVSMVVTAEAQVPAPGALRPTGDRVDVIDTDTEKQALDAFKAERALVERRLQAELDLLATGSPQGPPTITSPSIETLVAEVNAAIVEDVLADPVAIDPNRNVSLVGDPDRVFDTLFLLVVAEIRDVLARASSTPG